MLVLVKRISDKISVFSVDPAIGLLGRRSTFNSSGAGPFGFEFSRDGFFILKNAVEGARLPQLFSESRL